MTFEQITEAASNLDDDGLRRLERWIRLQLDPPVAGGVVGNPGLELPGSEHLTYRLKYFRCGNVACRCTRGHLHGPYLFATRHASDGSHRQFYIGRVAVDRPDDERQLELDLR